MVQIPPAVIADIVQRTESTLGLAPNVAQFHAYDEHQQPLPDQLTASQYAEWLLKTNSQRSPEDLELLAQRYRDAFTSQRTAIGITPGQLAHLAIAADVLEWLVRQTAPQMMPQPVPAAPVAPLAPVRVEATMDVPAPAPAPAAEEPVREKPVIKPASKPITEMLPEEQEDLQLLRKQLLSELQIPEAAQNGAVSRDTLQENIEKLVKEKSAELRLLEEKGSISANDRDTKLIHERRELERRGIELQSIEARMHFAKGADTVAMGTPAAVPDEPSTEIATQTISLEDHARALETLRKQEQEVIAEMDAMEKILDHAGLPPTELQHIRRQLHAVEELMKDIQAETK
jgi:predicted DNA-binding protein (UPF0251 family)